eukprot:325662-Heterocapsa_arctica.AAC.1
MIREEEIQAIERRPPWYMSEHDIAEVPRQIQEQNIRLNAEAEAERLSRRRCRRRCRSACNINAVDLLTAFPWQESRRQRMLLDSGSFVH